jgi:hypothetical protein
VQPRALAKSRHRPSQPQQQNAKKAARTCPQPLQYKTEGLRPNAVLTARATLAQATTKKAPLQARKKKPHTPKQKASRTRQQKALAQAKTESPRTSKDKMPSHKQRWVAHLLE